MKADASIEFLREFHGDALWVLVAIHPDRSKNICITRTFLQGEEAKARIFIDRWNGTYNLYFLIAEPKGVPTKKPRKTDILRTFYFWVDVDPRTGEDLDEERERIRRLCTSNLPEGVPEPTFVVDSGRGYWCFWRLVDPVVIDGDLDLARNAELYNIELERRFGADSCHNIDRIARLPGTLNMKTKEFSIV